MHETKLQIYERLKQLVESSPNARARIEIPKRPDLGYFYKFLQALRYWSQRGGYQYTAKEAWDRTHIAYPEPLTATRS